MYSPIQDMQSTGSTTLPRAGCADWRSLHSFLRRATGPDGGAASAGASPRLALTATPRWSSVGSGLVKSPEARSMSEIIYDLREAKTHLSRLIDRAANGEEIILSKA